MGDSSGSNGHRDGNFNGGGNGYGVPRSFKEYFGIQSATYGEKITSERVSAFCRAIGKSENLEEEQQQVPPTFLTRFRQGEFELLKQMALDLSHVLHAEQEYDFESRMEVGDEISFQTSLADVIRKESSNGVLHFLTFRTEIKSDQGGRRMGQANSILVVREQKR